MDMISDDIGILIPALDPDERLLTLVDNLRQKFEAELHIVIVDDGSSSKTIFERLAARKDERLKILQHTTNMGKGSALKTGFHYYIDNFPSLKGIATLDADGQHTVDSLSSCINLFVHHENELVIGARTFSKNIPPNFTPLCVCDDRLPDFRYLVCHWTRNLTLAYSLGPNLFWPR